MIGLEDAKAQHEAAEIARSEVLVARVVAAIAHVEALTVRASPFEPIVVPLKKGEAFLLICHFLFRLSTISRVMDFDRLDYPLFLVIGQKWELLFSRN